jgi:hypothetical protein
VRQSLDIAVLGVKPWVNLLLHQEDFYVNFIKVLRLGIVRPENTKDYTRITRLN